MPCASIMKIMKLKKRRWFSYTAGRTAKAAITGRTQRRCFTVLGTPHLTSQQSARPHQQNGDEENIRQEIGPGAVVALHEHVGDAVDQAAEHRPQGTTERATNDDGKRRHRSAYAHARL